MLMHMFSRDCQWALSLHQVRGQAVKSFRGRSADSWSSNSMTCVSLPHGGREVVHRWMDPVRGPVQLRFVVPAFIEICNKTQQDRTGFGKRVPPLCKVASVRLSLQVFCFEAVSLRLPLQGFCFEVVSERLPSPGGVFGTKYSQQGT